MSIYCYKEQNTIHQCCQDNERTLVNLVSTYLTPRKFDYSASSSIHAINELVGSSSWLFYSWVLDTHEQAVHIIEHQGKDKGAIFPENGKTRHLKKTSTKIYKK